MLFRVIILILKVYHVDYQLKYYTLLCPVYDLRSYRVCLLASWAPMCRGECDGGSKEEDSQSDDITLAITHVELTDRQQWIVSVKNRRKW